MKKYLSCLTCILLTYSCTLDEKKPNIELIQGDWISDTIPVNWGNGRFIFSFEDTLCTYLYAWCDYTNFKIKDSLLLIKETKFEIDDTSTSKETYTFKIIKLNKDTLQLNPLNGETRSLFSGYDKIKRDTITLIKVKAKNKIEPSNISFFSSRCFGTCPSIFLEIDSSRSVKFFGQYYTKLKGGYKGIIGLKDYLSILRKFQNIQLDSINENYSSGWTDLQTCGIVIDYENKSLHSRVYGFDKEPIELRILFHKLFEIYKSIDLKKDSLDLSDFKHKEMYYSIVPPPPPPFSQQHKFIPPKSY